MNRILSSLLIAALICIAPALVVAQAFYGITRVNPDAAGTSERSPILQLGRDSGIYIAYIKGNSNGDIYFTHSSDNGANFMTPTRVTMTGGVNANFQRTAQFVLDTKDNIHMVWMEDRVNDQPDIWYSHSTNKGMTWSMPMCVVDADDSSKYMQDFCSIAVDSSDNLYVSFLDFREEQRKTTMYGELRLTRSNDGGKTWSANTKVNVIPNGIGGTCECCKQDIAVSPEGHVYIGFRSNINNKRDIWVARSMDKGDTFEEAIQIQSGVWTIQACPVSGPNVTLDGKEDLHIVWCDSRDDSAKSNAYYSRLPKDSRQATPNQKLNRANESPKWPDVATTPDGSRVQATYQVQLKPIQFVFQIQEPVSPIGGWEIYPTGKTQEFGRVKIAPSGGTIFAWQDNSRDNGDIYFGRHAAIVSVPSTETISNEVKVFPNPSSGIMNLSWEDMKLPLSTTLRLEIYSAGGELVKQLDVSPSETIDLQDIPSGTYQLVIYDGSKQLSTQKLSVVR
ncbi:MAG TPA: exo-alpha-sialidase [Candidatus Kapabacteria bacterium]